MTAPELSFSISRQRSAGTRQRPLRQLDTVPLETPTRTASADPPKLSMKSRSLFMR